MGKVLKFTQDQEFKANLDSLTYEDILKVRFADLKYCTREWCGDITISCTFTVSKVVWDSWRKAGHLGQIYNCDLSNHLYRLGVLDFYSVPSVSDRARAKNGRKTISVEFTKRGAR